MPQTRTRRSRNTPTSTLADLNALVDALIKENRSLKRQLAKLEAAGATTPRRGRTADPVKTGLTRLNRKLASALSTSTPTRARRAAPSATPRRPRKPATPEVAAKRLEALAKARAARAAKKASSESS